MDHGIPAERATPSGIVGYLAEPDLAPFIGQQLRFDSILVPPDGHRPRTRLLDQHFGGALLFLEGLSPDGARVHGSAFLVAPGVALTAWHTIKDWQEAGHFDDPGYAILACGTNSSSLRIWQVRACSGPIAGGDVALLTLAPRFPFGAHVQISHFALSAALPRVGSEVTTLGFRLEPAEEVLPLNDGEHVLPPISVATISSTGIITDHYMTGIPRIRAPCFAADVFSIGGMSGGPVFDKRGYVVGIVSESIGGDNPDEYITFASFIWPAALFAFEGVWPQGLLPGGSCLKESWVHEGWRIQSTASGELAYFQGGHPEFIGPPRPEHLRD